jgi:phosphoribosylformylglycinamidine synthase
MRTASWFDEHSDSTLRIHPRIQSLETRRRAEAVLFSESQSRILASVAPRQAGELERLADDAGVPLSRLGVTGGDHLEVRVNGERTISKAVASLREAWWTAIERGLNS